MNLHLHIPSGTPLAAYITGIWEVRDDTWINETIIPQGVIEIIFNLGGNVSALLPGSSALSSTPACFIQGLYTKGLHIHYESSQHLFGIRLQPGMVKSLLGILPCEVKNLVVDLALIKPTIRDTWYRLKEAASFQERVAIIETCFPVITAERCLRTDAICELFREGSVEHFQSVSQLSKEVCYSTRQLNRKAQSLFGLSAEELVNYKKFLHAVKLLHAGDDTLTAVALDSGFFDQAHFCRVFKSYTGITAGEYRVQKGVVPFHVFS